MPPTIPDTPVTKADIFMTIPMSNENTNVKINTAIINISTPQQTKINRILSPPIVLTYMFQYDAFRFLYGLQVAKKATKPEFSLLIL